MARFPRVAASLESIRAKLRAELGIKTPRPAGPHLDVPAAPASAPEAAGYPGRAGLSPAEQRAFDRFIATEGSKGKLTPQYEARLKAMSPDELRQAVSRNMGKQLQVEADQAEREAAVDTNKSDPLDPKFSKPPRDDGGGVTSRFNKIAPDYEVPQAKKIAARTGERITLFGDNYPGIDGVIGDPARPLQIKQPPPANGPAAVVEDAREAFTKASDHGYNQVEVHILAENLSVSEVRAKFLETLDSTRFLDGKVLRRVVVWCKDGVFVPSGPSMPTPVIHVTDDRRRAATVP
jgi:hypothetical protein